MIVEGAELGIWYFLDGQAGAEYIANYRKEKYGNNHVALADNVLRPETEFATSLRATVPAKVKTVKRRAARRRPVQVRRYRRPARHSKQPLPPPIGSNADRPVG